MMRFALGLLLGALIGVAVTKPVPPVTPAQLPRWACEEIVRARVADAIRRTNPPRGIVFHYPIESIKVCAG